MGTTSGRRAEKCGSKVPRWLGSVNNQVKGQTSKETETIHHHPEGIETMSFLTRGPKTWWTADTVTRMIEGLDIRAKVEMCIQWRGTITMGTGTEDLQEIIETHTVSATEQRALAYRGRRKGGEPWNPLLLEK